MAAKDRLIVDMDGVLADIYEQYITMYSEESGKRVSKQDVLGQSELEAFPNSKEYLRRPGFFRNAPVIDGAIKVLQDLNEAYEVFIVSSAMEFPNGLQEKYYWMEEHFPFISWRQLVLCGSKQVISGDIMIDDHFKNLDFFEGKTLLFTQPHNHGADENGHTRVLGWGEVAKMLL
ncbi:MAG: 5'(3')-deoxyribonucleotidase [Bacteroidota bacterium]